jgi:hypothetical protein
MLSKALGGFLLGGDSIFCTSELNESTGLGSGVGGGEREGGDKNTKKAGGAVLGNKKSRDDFKRCRPGEKKLKF